MCRQPRGFILQCMARSLVRFLVAHCCSVTPTWLAATRMRSLQLGFRALALWCSVLASLGTLGGEGVSGFARAFVRAGVPNCVLTMWHVDEVFCQGFMRQLYKHLHDGEDLAHAMQKSTVYMMQERHAPRERREKSPPLK